MATFLFLVSITATTILFIASAAEEVVSVTRRFFARRQAEHSSASPVSAPASPQVSVTSRAAPQPRVTASASHNDWVPDRAA